jgi:hypothetical protein
MPFILGANTLSAGGYAVDNSCRFDDGSSDYLSRTPGVAGDTKKFTISFWVKRSALGTDQDIFHVYPGSGERSQILFRNDDTLQIELEAANLNKLITTRLFRDVSAWYHIVVVYDSDNGTAGNRVILYVNGVRETSFSTETYPSLASTSGINTTTQHEISSYDASGYYFDGYLSEFNFIDGQALAPSDFGEFDEDSGIWKPIAYTGTYGTNGFYLEFKDSSALGDDTSGNTNDWTVNNLTSIDQTTDTPTNNFATLNPNMAYPSTNITISDGNLDVIRTAGTSWQNILSTFAPSSGKWYAELKVNSVGSNGLNMGYINLDKSNLQNLTVAPGEDAFSAGLYSNGGPIFYASGTTFATVGSPIATDIMQFAMDIDNGFLYWGKNGTWLNSADPESGVTGTGGLALSNLTSGGSYAMGVALRNSGDVTWNFGNPAFTISSGNSDANGYGNFEYAVPSGYYALNTKNLAEYG